MPNREERQILLQNKNYKIKNHCYIFNVCKILLISLSLYYLAIVGVAYVKVLSELIVSLMLLVFLS